MKRYLLRIKRSMQCQAKVEKAEITLPPEKFDAFRHASFQGPFSHTTSTSQEKRNGLNPRRLRQLTTRVTSTYGAESGLEWSDGPLRDLIYTYPKMFICMNRTCNYFVLLTFIDYRLYILPDSIFVLPEQLQSY